MTVVLSAGPFRDWGGSLTQCHRATPKDGPGLYKHLNKNTCAVAKKNSLMNHVSTETTSCSGATEVLSERTGRSTFFNRIFESGPNERKMERCRVRGSVLRLVFIKRCKFN